MNDIDTYNYGKGLGYKDNCEDSLDANDTSSTSSNYKTTNVSGNFLNVVNNSSFEIDDNVSDSESQAPNDIKTKRSNSSFTHLFNWFNKQQDPIEQSNTKKMGTRESIRLLFSQNKFSDKESDNESDDIRYDTIYTPRTNFPTKQDINHQLNEEQISKTKFGKPIHQETKLVQQFKGILKPTDFKTSNETRPKSVSFYEEDKPASSEAEKIEPLSGDTLTSPIKLEVFKDESEFFDGKIDLSKTFGQKESDDDQIVVKTLVTLDKKTIKFLQTFGGSMLEDKLLRNPKRLLELYASYIASLQAQRFKKEEEIKKYNLEKAKFELLLKDSCEKIEEMEMEIAQLTKDKEDNKKKFGGLYKKIKTIKKESKNNKNMKRYYNDFISAYCGMVTTLATESTTFEKLQNKNKGYVSDEFFKNQKNLKLKLLELNYRSVGHAVFNSKNEVDKLRKENSEMFKEIEMMLLQNLDYI